MAVVHKLLHSFSQVKDYEAEAKKNKERVLLVLRAHPITYSHYLLFGLILFFIPLLFGNYLSVFINSFNQQLFIVMFYYAVVYSLFLSWFYFWYFNIGVVTNRKIVDVDVNNLLNSITTATDILKVEEVEKRSLGIMGSLFDYGDIHVETAGETPSVEFLKTPKPAQVVKIINSNMRVHGSSKHNPNS